MIVCEFGQKMNGFYREKEWKPSKCEKPRSQNKRLKQKLQLGGGGIYDWGLKKEPIKTWINKRKNGGFYWPVSPLLFLTGEGQDCDNWDPYCLGKSGCWIEIDGGIWLLLEFDSLCQSIYLFFSASLKWAQRSTLTMLPIWPLLTHILTLSCIQLFGNRRSMFVFFVCLYLLSVFHCLSDEWWRMMALPLLSVKSKLLQTNTH